MADDDSLIGIIRDGQVHLKCGPTLTDNKECLLYLRRKHRATKDFPFCSAKQMLIEDCQQIKSRPQSPAGFGCGTGKNSENLKPETRNYESPCRYERRLFGFEDICNLVGSCWRGLNLSTPLNKSVLRTQLSQVRQRDLA